ncbi:hypothetical protein M1146_00060, partial [Patescibacteria group bacterium]|nr:hypothetical protein [Patescibacteria group bacterium]
MLETLLKSYSMFFHDYDLQLDRYNFNTSDMFIINNLGDEIDIDIYDSSSKAFLQEVRANEKAVVHTIKDNNKKIWARSFHMPNSIDVILKGPLKDQRQPLCFLPFNINKPKAYILPSQLPPLQISPSSDPSKFDTNNLVVEPIEEEIYENSRYDPILRLWRTPYFMGDPYQWTDGSCQVRKDMDSISVLSDQWEWVGRWEVDMDGVVNKDIDSDGWEYATSFNFFSMVSPRRAYNSMDLVRRRRWTRTRIPKRINNDYIHRPLTIFWDVKTSSDGSRAVEIRSSFQIKNELGYPLLISLNHRSWSEDFVIGPIAIGETISVSLLHSFASLIKFKPLGDHYDWSEYYPCHNHSYDFRNMKEAQCTFLGNNLIPEEKKSFRNEGEDDSFNVFFHIWTISENKSILIKLTPYYMIHNNMLCHFVYKCISVDSSNTSEGIVESSMIQSGQTSTIRQMNIQRLTYLSIQVGTYDWSSPLVLSKITKDSTEILEMIHSDNEKDKLPLCLYCYYDIDRVLHVELYFKVAIVDKSNLHLLVSTNYISNSEAPSPATKDSSSRRKLPTTITKGFQILDQSLLDISLDNLLTVSASRHQEYTLTKNASSSPNHLGSTSIDSSILKSPLIEDIQTTSDHIIDFVKCDLGNNVYSDSKYKWSHLPFYLQKRMSLRLAHADRVSRSPNFLKFTSKKLLIVCVLMHIQANNKFLVQEGYQKLTEIAIAKRIVNKKLIEVHYQILGKILYPGDEVILRGPWDSSSLNENSCSYSIALIPIEDLYKELQVPEDTNNYNRRQLLEQLLFQNKFSLEFAGLCWTESCHDITAFYTEDNLIQVRPQSEDSWSDKIDIDTRKNSTTKDSFDVHCPRSGLIYHLSYTIENLPGLYHRTQVVTFMPRYCILNFV